jgi:hypothetical protein
MPVTSSKFIATSLFLAATILCGVTTAKADTVYNYVGNDFTGGLGTLYTTADSVDISITLSAPLPFTSSLQAYTPTAFSFTDGVQTITNMTPGIGITDFFFATSGGVIDEWIVAAKETGDVDLIESCGFANCSPATFDSGQTVIGEFGVNTADPGTWTATTSTSPVPEPSCLTLLGTGILGLAGAGRRKFL